jgi:uncharacterized protein (TIGR00730 family)
MTAATPSASTPPPSTGSRRFTLCVYCGSRSGDSPAFSSAAGTVGRAIGQLGWGLVYGGGRAGLMGTVADAVLAAGGHVTGVIPRSLMERELGHTGAQELHVVETMHQRKMLMAERADAFLALPGGIGTFEELFEVWTWRQLGYHDKPVGLLDVDGFYRPLLEFLAGARDRGFMDATQHALLHVGHDVHLLLDNLRVAADRAAAPDDYRRI